MSDFYVCTNQSKNVNTDLMSLDVSLLQCEKQIEGIKANPMIPDLLFSIEKLLFQIKAERTDTGKLNEAFEQIKELYTGCEQDIIANGAAVSNHIQVADASGADQSNWWDNAGVDAIKAVLDLLAGFGDGTTIVGGIPLALVKALLDGDFTAKDWGSLIKATGKSVTALIKNAKGIDDWEKFWGLSTYKTLTTDAAAGWLNNAGKTFADTFKDKFGVVDVDANTGAKSVSGAKAAGWALSLVANGFSNYEEYTKANGAMSKGRAVAETISETLIDMGKGAALTAGVAAACAAAGVAAPAVVVAGGAVVLSLGIDYVGKAITGDKSFSLTEKLSDAILDTGTAALKGAGKWLSDIGKQVSGAASKSKGAVCGWKSKASWSFA